MDADYSGITVTLTATPVAPATTTYSDQTTTTDSTGDFVFTNPITVDNYSEYAIVTITASYPGYTSQSFSAKVGCNGFIVSFGTDNTLVLSADADHVCACQCLLHKTYHATCEKGSCDLVYSQGAGGWIGTVTWSEPEGAITEYVNSPDGTRCPSCAVKATVNAHVTFILSCGATNGTGDWTCAMYSNFSWVIDVYSTHIPYYCYGYTDGPFGHSVCQDNDPYNWRSSPRFLDLPGTIGLASNRIPFSCGGTVNLTFAYSPTSTSGLPGGAGWPPETPLSVTITE